MIKKTIVLFFINLVLISFAIAGVDTRSGNEEALDWLKRMVHAMKVLNYQGTVVFMKNGHLDTMKYSHAAANGIEQERMLSLNSPMREVIRNAHTISCTFKKNNKRLVNHRPASQSLLMALPKQISTLAESYRFVLSGRESVAMRTAQVIAIQPKDDFRYARKIWLDKQNYLPLKVEIYNQQGATLEQVVFTDIKVEEVIPFSKPDETENHLTVQHIHQAQTESFHNALFALNNIPIGFKKVFFTRVSLHKSGQLVDHLLLSDGLSSISVYLDNNKDDEIKNGLQIVGSVNSYSRVIGDYQVVVLGEVPTKTVEFIAQGITLVTSQ